MRDLNVPPISNRVLLELADALDIRTRGYGDLGCTHWSVNQVDLYSVLDRHGLIVTPDALAFGAKVQNGGTPGSYPHPLTEAAQHRVFIVHGHDEPAKFAVQALLAQLGFVGVILDEQTGRGAAIIEKFKREAGAATFAVVLLTPDDKGGVSAASAEQLKPRARQNVILELGYFAAKLGRGRVCALRRGNVEIPSDFSGVQYLDYDAGGAWRGALAKEMRDAGLPVDLNRL